MIRLTELFQAEARASIARIMDGRLKAEAVAADLDCGRSQMYAYAKGAHFPLDKALFLGIHDPDPEALMRMGTLFYRAAAAAAEARAGRDPVPPQAPRLDFGEEPR